MLSAKALNIPHAEGDGEPVKCGYCPKTIIFRVSYLGGHAVCFDAALTPASRDTERTGWILGQFPIDGQLRDVWAPRRMHGAAGRRRALLVAQLHHCSGLSRNCA